MKKDLTVGFLTHVQQRFSDCMTTNDVIELIVSSKLNEKVQAGKDQEKVQSEKDSHSKNRSGKKLN